MKDIPLEERLRPILATASNSSLFRKPLNAHFSFNTQLQKMTTGKQLLLEDLPFSLEKILSHFENGYLIFRKGIEFTGGGQARCVRCGNEDSSWFGHFPCARCHQAQCLYCRKCLMMGRISSCSLLISWAGPIETTLDDPRLYESSDAHPPKETGTPLVSMEEAAPRSMEEVSQSAIKEAPSSAKEESPSSAKEEAPSSAKEEAPSSAKEEAPSNAKEGGASNEVIRAPSSAGANIPQYNQILKRSSSLLAWSGKLSDGQQKASNQVVETMNKKEELLVWAVCGAGKTEVLFAGIESALQQGHRVCMATPRTDVVLELTPRLRAAFPTITIASLYGGSPDRHLYAPLTIATTHQLLRFYHAFDSIVVDEVDAFPYSADKTLQYAVKQARKPQSALIYLTATPNEKWQKECRSGKRTFVTIPARYHRHPLSVPEFVWCGNWAKQLKKNTLPPIVMKWITDRLHSKKQALLFIPKISLLEKIVPILKNIHPAIEGVHSEDPTRKDKVMMMRNHDLLLLLTTTILERGVTFPNIDVAILGAEDRIFTESALVQIAGRVGRSASYPSGTITFFHYGKTNAMVKARRQIIDMNSEAKRLGLID